MKKLFRFIIKSIKLTAISIRIDRLDVKISNLFTRLGVLYYERQTRCKATDGRVFNHYVRGISYYRKQLLKEYARKEQIILDKPAVKEAVDALRNM